jgi:kynurenine formamidase
VWFFGDGVVLDMTAKSEGDPMTAADAQAALARIGYVLKPLDIVLVRTGRDRHYGQADYMFRGCGVTAEATQWLYDQGVRVMGIDAWGWDAPLDRQAREALARRQQGIFWAAHQVDLPYAQIERLVNLDALPPFGFKISCFPLKIAGGSAGPARVVALLEN